MLNKIKYALNNKLANNTANVYVYIKIHTFVNTNEVGDDSGVTWYIDLLILEPSGESDDFFMEPTDSERFTAIEPYCLESPISDVICFILSVLFCSEFNMDLIPLIVFDKEDVEELLAVGGFLVVGGGGGKAGFLLTPGPKDLFSIWL